MAENLVSIPWQPQYKLTQSTLNLLGRAVELAGHNIVVDDAWRSYASQKYYYDGWKAGLPGFNVASDPDKGQRNHMRGAAVDISNKSDRQFMLAAGFTPDPDEWWHFNNPNWQGMPIIPTDTSVAGGGAVPIVEPAPVPRKKKGKTLNFWHDTNGTIFYGNYAIPNMTVYNLLVRYDTGVRNTFNPAERDMIRAALRGNGLPG